MLWAMSAAAVIAGVASIGALCVGVGLLRRGRRTAAALLAGAVVVAAVPATFGEWRPLLVLIAIAGFFVGMRADLPGHPARRALGLLGITVGLFALLIAAVYA